jgi:hypothetical protein
MKIKHIKLIFFIIAACAFIVFFINGYYKDKKEQTAFIEEEFHGIIMEIKYVEGNRGDPYVKIGNQWIVFGPREDKVRNYISVEDSIVKKMGTVTIKVYRKNVKGSWDEKVFK